MSILLTIFIPVFVQHSPDWLKYRCCTGASFSLYPVLFKSYPLISTISYVIATITCLMFTILSVTLTLLQAAT